MRAVELYPSTDADHSCPYCRGALRVEGWHINGMRNLAELLCPACGREFFGDLAAGQALYTPLLLEKATGAVHDPHGVEWFAGWLRDSYARRVDEPVPFDVREHRPVKRPVVLLNCLDTLYGHSLLKLLNAQHHLDRQQDCDLVVMVPSFLAWMVPDGVAQTWIVGLPLQRGTEWNEWLAREVRRRVEAFGRVSLAHALSHPRPDEFDIERFTRVKPFSLDEWNARLVRPTVTFIWRDDRPWRAAADAAPSTRREQFRKFMAPQSRPGTGQTELISKLAEALRRDLPALDFAVAGLLGSEERVELPGLIGDLRRTTLDADAERVWCERYAASHVVELIGPERWGNFAQDILFRDAGDCREMLFRYRFVDELTAPSTLAQLVGLTLRGRDSFRRLMNVL
jgi:hypothetical protein